jgi:GNAT superfamily N-acetyltransferase
VATAERWGDLARLFGERGACAGCWCMWARLTASEFRAGAGDKNRRTLQRIVRRGDQPGILAYVNGEPVGWCALAPRNIYVRLEGSRVLAPVDDQPVWSVVCFFVARGWRGRGVTVALLEQAAKFAARSGARVLEGYPIDPRDGARPAGAFVWTGLKRTFDRAGFREIARRSPTRPIMRRELRARGG